MISTTTSRRRRPLSQEQHGTPRQDEENHNSQDECSSTETHTEILPTTEIGYILLSHCSIVLPSERTYPRQKWIQVALNPSWTKAAAAPPAAKNKNNLATTTCTNDDRHPLAEDDNEPSPCSGSNMTNEPCPYCNVILHDHFGTLTSPPAAMKAEDELKLGLCTSASHSPRFHGTMADTVHGYQQQSPPSSVVQPQDVPSPGTNATDNNNRRCGQPRREDAALVLGALLQAQDDGYVSIQDVQIMLFPPSASVGGDDGHGDENKSNAPSQLETEEGNQMISDAHAYHHASLLVTVSFPSLLAQSNNTSGQPTTGRRGRTGTSLRSIQPSHANNNKNIKPLPPSVQFVLSILRSDWNQLDAWMEQLQCDGFNKMIQQRQSPTLVPSKLSLEELYCRIRGSSGRVEAFVGNLFDSQQEQSSSSSSSQSREKLLDLLSLPLDILQKQIAPLLRAKSLDSLRCTCKSLHQSLQSVVPGLKLKLFSHQITSLQWMRRREVQPITEANGHEMLTQKIRASTNSGGSSPSLLTEDDNDPIRAMTGGQSVWLCPRPSTGGDSTSMGIRIDQMTGNEMEMETLDANGSDIAARQGARGGLLCDDPGKA